MAHTKAKGTSKLGRDSISKRLGVKVFGGQKIKPGMLIIRQRGSKYYAGDGVAMAADDTLYAKKEGTVDFTKNKIRMFTGRKREKTVVSVCPERLVLSKVEGSRGGQVRPKSKEVWAFFEGTLTMKASESS